MFEHHLPHCSRYGQYCFSTGPRVCTRWAGSVHFPGLCQAAGEEKDLSPTDRGRGRTAVHSRSCYYCCGTDNKLPCGAEPMAPCVIGTVRSFKIGIHSQKSSRKRKITGGLDSVSRVLAIGSLLLLQLHATIMPTARALVSEASMDVRALDQRISSALELFERGDPAAGEAELRDMATQNPSYAPASFYMGLLSQKRHEPQMAVGFYAAALHAGMCCFLTYYYCGL